MVQDFKKRFIISTILTIPVLLLSPMIQGIFDFAIIFPGSLLVLSSLATFIYCYGGWPFLKGFILELKQKKAGMMTLVTLAITTAHAYSLLVALDVIYGKIFFWEVATLIDVMLLGHWIEMKSVMGASKALEKLAHLLPSSVSLLLPDGSIKQVDHSQIQLGNKVLVKPGEKIPADGVVTEGHAYVNESMLTGESRPVFKTTNDAVIGGSINQNGSLVVQVNKIGSESYLAKIITLVKSASTSKSHAQTIANKAAFVLTIVAIVSGVTTLAVWLVVGAPTHFALERMVTVMVIACPHALGLAIPLVIASTTTLGAKNGLLIKNRTSFEQARHANVVVFDKTGTLTTGNFGVTKIVPLSDWSGDKILQHASAVERRAEHSIAKSIVKKADLRNIKIPQIANFKNVPGIGARAFVEGQDVFVGSPDIITGHDFFQTNFVIQEVSDVQHKIQELTGEGKTIVIVATKDSIKGLIVLSDVVRNESVQACRELEKLNIKTAMITGDTQAVADNVADQLGITHVFSKVLPDQKAEKIKALQEKGFSVIMVGDGINDAPALAQADVGIAIGSGTDVAAETADVILVQNDPRDVVGAIRLSKLMNRKIKQNLAWATGYNVVALPLAAGILYTYGILIPPAIGAFIMSISTIIVALNSRIRR